jgi:hypothetical protein
MRVKILDEFGSPHAAFGQGFSYGLTSESNFRDFSSSGDSLRVWGRIRNLLQSLAGRGGGHDKFLRMIYVWVDIDAPRYWWSQMDTYKVGTVALSESTMHTLTKRPLTLDDFEVGVCQDAVDIVNDFIAIKDWEGAKKNLPEGFLQRRIWSANYAVLQNIIQQRSSHRLPEWRKFCDEMILQAQHPEFLVTKYYILKEERERA